MKRHIILTMFAAAVMTLVVTIREARSGDAPAETAPVTASTAPAGAVFQGCWSFFPSGSCSAIYRDTGGNYLKCGKCGPTGQPNPNNCGATTAQTLATGFWCS